MGIVFPPRTHYNNWGTQGLVQCPAPTSCVWCSGWPGTPFLLLVAAPNSPGWPGAPSLLLVAAPNFPWKAMPLLSLVFVTESVTFQAWLPEYYRSLASIMAQGWARHPRQGDETQFWMSDGTIRKETAFLTAATNWETITPRLKTEKAQK